MTDTPLATPADTDSPRRSRRKDARPGELLAAALDLFVERGFSATRVEDVAARAGVSKGTLFLYFPTKTELFKAVVRDSIVGRLQEFASEIAKHEGDTAQLVGFAMHAWWERVGDTKAGGITKLMMAEASNFPELASFYLEEVIAPATELIRSIMRRGVQRGEFRHLDLEESTQAIIAPLIHLTCWKHSFGNTPCSDAVLNPSAYLNTYLDVLLHGLVPRSASATSMPPTVPAAP